MSESRDVIRPSIGVEPNPVTGAMVAAINEAAAHAGRSHFGDDDLLRTLG
jgi:hypothetical protein